MKRTLIETVINFLLGAAWAIVILGAALFFWSFMPFGLFIAAVAAVAGSLFGLFLVVILEVAALQFDKYRQLRKQTILLEKIERRLSADESEQTSESSERSE